MFTNWFRFVTTCGFAVGLLFVGQDGRAEQRNSAPENVAGGTAVGGPQKPAIFLRAARGGPRRPADADSAGEPLSVLKTGPEHTRLVYPVKTGSVFDFETTIKQLFHLEAELHPSSGSGGKGIPAARVAIAVSKVGNSLVISGPPDAVEEVRTVLDKLDQPQGLVLLEMEIGETSDSATKPAGAAAAVSRPSAAATTDAFRLLARPANMETTGRVRLVAANNEPAFVQLGARVPRVASTLSSAKGQTTTTVLDNVGLILGVTARIEPHGTIALQVDAEQSQLGPEKEGIPISVAGDKIIRTPRIETAMVQTSVTIPDGQTIILGSMPRQAKSDREMLIIVTPHIIRPSEAVRPR